MSRIIECPEKTSISARLKELGYEENTPPWCDQIKRGHVSPIPIPFEKLYIHLSSHRLSLLNFLKNPSPLSSLGSPLPIPLSLPPTLPPPHLVLLLLLFSHRSHFLTLHPLLFLTFIFVVRSPLSSSPLSRRRFFLGMASLLASQPCCPLCVIMGPLALPPRK